MSNLEPILWLSEVNMQDVDKVGGKNAALGEMLQSLTQVGVKVPPGFATTTAAYTQFLQEGNLGERVQEKLRGLNVDNLDALQAAGHAVREMILAASFAPDFIKAIKTAYEELVKQVGSDASFAVRSSATAEDLANASFAGQQATYLNVVGIDNILVAVKQVFASLYTDRAIAYRVHQGFPHEKVGISVGVQQMIRSDSGASGVMFTIDTESGFDQVVFITSSYGLGETIVQGKVNPDEFYVHKPTLMADRPAILRRTLGRKQEKMIYAQGDAESVKIVPVEANAQQVFSLTDEEVLQLARYAILIETHYQKPMDIEWAKDGKTRELYIVQARPETVVSQNQHDIQRYHLHSPGEILVEGRAIGQRIGHGIVRVVKSLADIHLVQPGDVLVTDMTDPDWEPVMKRAAAIVTNRGGRTCHAAILARELGIPAVVGCQNATERLLMNNLVTVSCAEGETGFVYAGQVPYDINTVNVQTLPELPLKLMMNVGDPDRAFGFQKLPNAGVGLARLEFIISRMIGIHPNAILRFNAETPEVKAQIRERMAGYATPVDFYVQKLIEGISTIVAAFYPKPVIVRLSDFKSNEYAHLIGGDRYEPKEENPMIGFRGASRYVSDSFKECFALEVRAIKYIRDEMGLTNLEVMVPFVRTTAEAKAVVEILAAQGLARGDNGLKLIMMCEVPSNALLAEEFLQYFDGFSIGSNDLTQLTLGLDRDSGLVAAQFDERNDAVKVLLHRAIRACLAQNKYIGICGQGPSDHLDFAKWLVKEGIQSISLNPDSVIETWSALASRV